MASLPYHGRLFGARQTPLSRFQLNKRLAWLDPEHAAVLDSIEQHLRWSRNLLLETDAEFLGTAKRLVEDLGNDLLKDVVKSRLEMRTMVAALRKRAIGQPAPAEHEAWGYGRFVNLMRIHWADPDFGLGHIYPWLSDAQRAMQDNNVLGLERLFMQHSWEYLARAGAGHYFDFEAVAIYVLRWDLIDRWTRYEEDAAQQRITGLAKTGLGVYQQVFH